MKKLIVIAFTLMIGAFVSTAALATVPDLIPVQGVLADDLGAPVDGATDITFALYADETGGSALWSDPFLDVDVVEGFFTVYLGSQTTLDLTAFLANAELWLGMNVEGDGEMDRIQLAAVPFAIEAQVCQAVGSLTEADINANFAPTSHTHDGVYATDAHNHDADYSAIGHNHDASYAPISHTHAWSTIADIPAGFADGVDDDTLYAAGDGLTLVGTTFGVSFAGTGTATTAARSDHDHDTTYVNEGQAGSISGAMIVDGATLSEIADDDGAGSGLDADLLDGQHGSYYATATHGHSTLTKRYQRDDAAEETRTWRPPYHLSITTAYAGSTKAIDDDLLRDYCGDGDGCEIRLGMTRWSSDTETETASRGPCLFYYDYGSDRWRVNCSGADVSGTNYNFVTNHILNAYNTCYFTDSEYSGYTDLGDSSYNFGLLMWNGYTGPTRTCELTIID